MKTKYASLFDILIIPITYCFIVLILSYYHSTFEEWDGVMQYFSGKEIMAGTGYHGWTSHFWPPLSSLLIGLGSELTSGFFAGKFVSNIAAVLTLVLVYLIVLEFTKEKTIAYIAQILIAINPVFALSAIQVENHMLDTLFFVGSFYFLVRLIKEPEDKFNVVFLAVFTAFAMLSRYTSYVLIPLIIIALIIFVKKGRFIQHASMFAAIVLIINGPWYYYNYIHNGSPLFTWQYINIGSRVYPEGRYVWLWEKQSDYSSVSQIFLDYPIEYLVNFLKNIIKGTLMLAQSMSFILILFSGILFIYRKKIKIAEAVKNIAENKFIQILLLGYILFITLVSQAFVFTQVFLSWIVLFSIMLLVVASSLLRENHTGIAYAFIAVFGILNISYTGAEIYKYCNDDTDDGELVNYKEVAQALSQEEGIEQRYIMADNPSRAYYSKSYFIKAPSYFKGTVDEFVRYHGIHEKTRMFAPKYPSKSNLENIRADYLIYDESLKGKLPQFSFLFDQESSKIPDNFHLKYKSDEVVVYKIEYAAPPGEDGALP